MSHIFTLYLVDSNYQNIERYSIINGNVVENIRSIFNNGVTSDDNLKIKEYVERRKENYRLIRRSQADEIIYFRESDTFNPWWKSFWNVPEQILNKSTDAIIIKELFGRIFIITHGHGGRHFINPYAYEYDFGLRIAINVIDDGNVQSANMFTPSECAMRTTKQTGKTTKLNDFEIDVYKTLLKTISGKVRKEYASFLENIDGADCVKFPFSGSKDDFEAVIKQMYDSYQKDEYKKNGFEWIDNYRIEKNQTIVGQLNEKLKDEINSRSNKIALSYPIYAESVIEVQFKYKSIIGRSKTFPILDIETQYYKILEENGLLVTVDDLKKHQIAIIDYADGKEINSYAVYSVLYAEVELGRQDYFLESGKWYKVDSSFISEVNDAIANLYKNKIDFGLKYDVRKYSGKAAQNKKNNEKLFNTDLVAQLSKIGPTELLDCKLIYYDRNSIELCDVLHKCKDDSYKLIHNKIYHGSSTLSHLFGQGYVSAELIADEKFVIKANNKIINKKLKIDVKNIVDRSKYSIVYGIIVKKNNENTFHMPLFSKINIYHFCKSIIRLGYSVELALIEIV
jgi:uncharacterized protein (TIGR04141 family)